MCDVPATPVQGGLGLPEVQAVPGLRAAEPLPEGQLLGDRRCRLWGLLARVSQGFLPHPIFRDVSFVPFQP